MFNVKYIPTWIWPIAFVIVAGAMGLYVDARASSLDDEQNAELKDEIAKLESQLQSVQVSVNALKISSAEQAQSISHVKESVDAAANEAVANRQLLIEVLSRLPEN